MGMPVYIIGITRMNKIKLTTLLISCIGLPFARLLIDALDDGLIHTYYFQPSHFAILVTLILVLRLTPLFKQ